MLAARALALIGPLAVLFGWWGWLSAADDDIAALPRRRASAEPAQDT